MTETNVIGRNEPCPCGSRKKYKRCCGADAAPKLTQAKAPVLPGGAPFDPNLMNQFDPQMMTKMSQALQRLPKGQIQRLQVMMQKAMSGQDVSGEAADFEKSLPPDFQTLLQSFAMPAMEAMNTQNAESEAIDTSGTSTSPDTMSLDQARSVIEKAVSEGKLTQAQATELLSQSTPQLTAPQVTSSGETEKSTSKGFGKLWGKLTGKKDSTT